jgi:hypothetical protein
MGKMIEKIWIGNTSSNPRAEKLEEQIWIRSADHHTGPRRLDVPQLN